MLAVQEALGTLEIVEALGALGTVEASGALGTVEASGALGTVEAPGALGTVEAMRDHPTEGRLTPAPHRRKSACGCSTPTPGVTTPMDR